jgi:hypothetical protein
MGYKIPKDSEGLRAEVVQEDRVFLFAYILSVLVSLVPISFFYLVLGGTIGC